MSRDRSSFIAGFMPPLTMAMLLAVEYALTKGSIAPTHGMLILAGILPFFVPFLFILLLRRRSKPSFSLRLKGFTRRGIGFVFYLSAAAALLSFLLNSLVSTLFGQPIYGQMADQQALAQSPLGMSLLVIVVLPSVFEELLFRGGVLGAFEGHGTYAALFVSALSFALVHGNPANLVGPFVAGLIYGYMCWVLDSIWPAVIAHLVNNVYYMFMSYATRAYESLGFWPYLLIIAVLAFGFFLYLAMGQLEKLIERGKIPRLRRVELLHGVTGVVAAPGLWLLALMYVFKILYA